MFKKITRTHEFIGNQFAPAGDLPELELVDFAKRKRQIAVEEV